MGVHLSIKAKLVLATSAGKELKFAMEEFNRACNTLSELAFQQDRKNAAGEFPRLF